MCRRRGGGRRSSIPTPPCTAARISEIWGVGRRCSATGASCCRSLFRPSRWWSSKAEAVFPDTRRASEAACRAGRRLSRLPVICRIHLKEGTKFLGKLVVHKDGLHRAFRHASAAVDAHVWVDVELGRRLKRSLPV